MADNISLPATGVNARTDDVGGFHYQYVKLATSEDGSGEGIGDRDLGSSRAMFVDARPNVVHAATNSSGLTTATTAYVTGDVLGAGWTVANAARATGGTGMVTGIELLDKSDILSAVDLFLSSGSITFGTDNAAPSVSDSDAEKLMGIISLTFVDVGGARKATIQTNVPYVCDGTDLFVYAVTRSGHTFFGAATDLRLRTFIIPD